MVTRRLGLLILSIAGLAPIAGAQMRSDQPEVLTPRVITLPPAPDFAKEFNGRYVIAGRPRILLYWNKELSERTGVELVLRDQQTVSGSKSVTAQANNAGYWNGSSTAGWYGSAVAGAGNRSASASGNTQVQIQQQREMTIGERQEAKRPSLLPTDAARFERAFEAEMRVGGVQFIDRALATRAAALKGGPATSQISAESAALRESADLVLQVLFVSDSQAPAGYGFDVSIRNTANMEVVTSFYTRAVPPITTKGVTFMATDRGFKEQGPAGPQLEEFAVQLAQEIMNQLGPVLPRVTAEGR